MTHPYGIPKLALKKRLKRRGVTHAMIADACHVDRSTVTHWLNGRLISKPIETGVSQLLGGYRGKGTIDP